MSSHASTVSVWTRLLCLSVAFTPWLIGLYYFCCHRFRRWNKNVFFFFASTAEIALGNPLKVIAHVGDNSRKSVCHRSQRALMPRCRYCRALLLMRSISQGLLLRVKPNMKSEAGKQEEFTSNTLTCIRTEPSQYTTCPSKFIMCYL